MKMSKNTYLRLACIAACGLIAVLGSGCNKRSAGTAAKPTATGGSMQAIPDEQLSLFGSTSLVKTPPLAMAFTRDCSQMFCTIVNARSIGPVPIKFDVSTGVLPEPVQMLGGTLLVQAFIQPNPDGTECLVKTSRKIENAVWDGIWRLMPPERVSVPFESDAGLPVGLPSESYSGLEPFYSWDGLYVITPIKNAGVCVNSLDGKVKAYVSYPKVDFAYQGMSWGVLPDEAGQRRAYVSFWAPGSIDDRCTLFVLDLDSRQWKKITDTTWIIYKAGGENLNNEPWLIVGSRAPRNNTEGTRFPRMGRVDPASGVVDLLEFNGAPDWDVALEPHGKYVAYTDGQRKALVRYSPATGAMDIDPRWFSEEAKVFMGEGGDPVFVWKGPLLLQAKWSKHEQFKGYAGK